MSSSENCLLCQIISNKIPSYKIYEDDICMAILDVNGAIPGHSFIIPKNHYPIIEQVPDEEMGHLFTVSNKISGAIFENLQVQGTNIFVRNGIPAGQQVAHFMINVIPRKENDNINLQWPTKQLSEEEMSTIELKLKDQIGSIGVSKQTTKKEKILAIPKHEPILDEEDDYFISQINRIP